MMQSHYDRNERTHTQNMLMRKRDKRMPFRFNEEILGAIYPGYFRRRVLRGTLFYMMTAVFGIGAIGSIGGAVGALFEGGSAALMAFGGVAIGVICVFLSCCFCLYARGYFAPFAHSLEAVRIHDAKVLYDEGLLETDDEPDQEKVTISFKDYTLFKLAKSYNTIDRTKHYDNYLSLLQTMKKEVQILIQQGAYGPHPPQNETKQNHSS